MAWHDATLSLHCIIVPARRLYLGIWAILAALAGLYHFTAFAAGLSSMLGLQSDALDCNQML
jgi:hypothetical protein